ncbi:MAG: dihydroorotase [Treponema sp.]|jgi:dihydroorotase|nr:dihydroorotase [Treponema sp.]
MYSTLGPCRIVDANTDLTASVVIEGGVIREVHPASAGTEPAGAGLVLMPAFIDLHAHFRDPGFPAKETLETGCRAAAAGGYGTVVCMANTDPVIDTLEQVRSLKRRSDALGLIDLYPVLSLTKGMAGTELSDFTRLSSNNGAVRLLSEDGRDVHNDALFLSALKEAARLGLPASLHCDAGGEASAVARALSLGRQAGCHVHIAHVSTKDTVRLIRDAKSLFPVTCEATPHHLALTEEDAKRLGETTFGKAAPPLRTEEDRQAVIAGLRDGTIDAIATDHAPHTAKDKAGGAPGFTGLETAFAVCHTALVLSGLLDLRRLSALMSAAPARILGLADRALIAPGLRADLVLVDTGAAWTVDPEQFASKGKNSPFAGQRLYGKTYKIIEKL